MQSRKFQILLALALVAIAVVLRLLPHPDNFAPLTAIALLAGATLPRRYAYAVPLAAVITSDAFIGFYGATMLVVWACYVVMALAASRWLKKASLQQGFAVTVASSSFFFVVTNFAVWLCGDMYAHSLNGLAQCYYLALPFFRNSLLGDLVYAASFFGIYQWVSALQRQSVVRKRRLVGNI